MYCTGSRSRTNPSSRAAPEQIVVVRVGTVAEPEAIRCKARSLGENRAADGSARDHGAGIGGGKKLPVVMTRARLWFAPAPLIARLACREAMRRHSGWIAIDGVGRAEYRICRSRHVSGDTTAPGMAPPSAGGKRIACAWPLAPSVASGCTLNAKIWCSVGQRSSARPACRRGAKSADRCGPRQVGVEEIAVGAFEQFHWPVCWPCWRFP